jgi:hypothetical protein
VDAEGARIAREEVDNAEWMARVAQVLAEARGLPVTVGAAPAAGGSGAAHEQTPAAATDSTPQPAQQVGRDAAEAADAQSSEAAPPALAADGSGAGSRRPGSASDSLSAGEKK